MQTELFVIYSPNESALTDGAGFWSNKDGWTEFYVADKFSHSEMQTLKLPVSTGQDARWVLRDEAAKHYGAVNTEALESFRHEVAICINCMLQDDARGGTMAFVREDGRLTPKVISADAIDLDNLQQYEMILFDGGNSAGDTWKHTFFPKQLKNHFVDENPLPRKATAGNMMVSLDGGTTFQPAPEGVRIAYQKVMVDGEDGRGELVINATHEGLITDLWVHRDEPEVSMADYNHNIGTDCVMIEDIVSRLIEENN